MGSQQDLQSKDFQIKRTKDAVVLQKYSGTDAEVTVPAGVTEIGAHAFRGCTAMTCVTLPATLVSIGYAAFQGCASLESVTIPTGVTTIEKFAFRQCNRLKRIDLPPTLTHIGLDAFGKLKKDPDHLEEVHITDLAAWCRMDFDEDVNDSHAYSANPLAYAHALYLNDVLVTDLIIPDGVERIGDRAFIGVTHFSDITIPASVRQVGRDAFPRGASHRLHITDLAAWCGIRFHNRMTNPMYYASSVDVGGVPLTNLVVPDGVTEVAACAFVNCPALTHLTLPASVTALGGGAFLSCTALESVRICGDVTELHSSTFAHCTALTSITLPDTITEIGCEAFAYCVALRSITLPAQLTVLRESAFLNCRSLERLTIPASVTQLRPAAFEGCQLRQLTILGAQTELMYRTVFTPRERKMTFIPADAEVTVYSAALYRALTAGVKTGDAPFMVSLVDERGEVIAASYSISHEATIYHTYVNILLRLKYPYGRTAEEQAQDLRDVTGARYRRIVLALAEARRFDLLFLLFGYKTPTLALMTAAVEEVLKSDDTEATARIMDMKYKLFTAEEIQAYEDKQLDDALSFDPFSATALRKVWTQRPNGAISGYKGTDPEAIIPDAIGKKQITVVEGLGKNAASFVTSIVIPEGVTTIGDEAFLGYTALESVTIPATVTTIGSRAFADCTALKYVHISDLAAWCRIRFVSDASNPIYYAKGLYLDGEPLLHLTVPEGITALHDYVFLGGKSFRSITLPDTLVSIGDYALFSCTRLKTLTVPPTVQEIGENCFAGCSAMKKITLPAQLSALGESAFSGCRALTSIRMPDGIDALGSYTFYDCPALTDVTLPEGIDSLGGYAFCGCASLKSIILPDSIISIGECAFSSCVSLTDISLPNSLRKIDLHAFTNCLALTDVTLPDSVRSVGYAAFRDCTSLATLSTPIALDARRIALPRTCRMLRRGS